VWNKVWNKLSFPTHQRAFSPIHSSWSPQQTRTNSFEHIRKRQEKSITSAPCLNHVHLFNTVEMRHLNNKKWNMIYFCCGAHYSNTMKKRTEYLRCNLSTVQEDSGRRWWSYKANHRRREKRVGRGISLLGIVFGAWIGYSIRHSHIHYCIHFLEKLTEMSWPFNRQKNNSQMHSSWCSIYTTNFGSCWQWATKIWLEKYS